MVLGFCLQLAKQIEAPTGNNCQSIIGTTLFHHLVEGTSAELERYVSQGWKTRQQYEQQSGTQKQQLKAGYDNLKKNYPEISWPKPGRGASEEEEEALRLYSSFYYASAVTTRRVFTTDSGYIGLAWAAVRPGDEVILIKGAKVPYIFRTVDDALQVEIDTAKKDIDYLERKFGKSKQAIQELRDKMQGLESRIGKSDGWVLVGEAYVEGVMDGETAERYADRFEVLTIV